MLECIFTRLTAVIEGPKVIFTRSETIETIFVAEDWHDGWEKQRCKEDFSQTGYIGCGTTKRVIYVHFWLFDQDNVDTDNLFMHRQGSMDTSMH
jgi:hypothetical protein